MKRLVVPLLALSLSWASTIAVGAAQGPPEIEFGKSCQGPNPDGSVHVRQLDSCTITVSRGRLPAGSTVTIEVGSPGFAPIASCSGTINSFYANECTYALPNGAGPGGFIGTESFVVPSVPSGTRVTQQALFCSVPWSCEAFNVVVSGPGSVITAPPPPDLGIALQPFVISSVEGQEFNGTVAIVQDLDPHGSPSEYNARVDWGDGSPLTPASFNGWSLVGSHTYLEEGSFIMTVFVNDNDNPFNRTSGARTATVTDAPLTATGQDRVSGEDFANSVASFSDADPFASVSDYTASIDWGDGVSSSGIVVEASAGFEVRGAHSYAALGPYTIAVHICDEGGSCTDSTSQVLIYGLSSGGTFVIGDGDAGIGSVATFWGAQWSAQNSLSGGAAPDEFKGFADDPSALSDCGTTWSTSPGNSAHPPDGVPGYMAVIVASSAVKDGPRISGDSPAVVIVKTDEGYGPDPGQPGIGTVVAILCP